MGQTRSVQDHRGTGQAGPDKIPLVVRALWPCKRQIATARRGSPATRSPRLLV